MTEQEEFEFRARAEAEQAQKAPRPVEQPSTLENIAAPIFGVGKAATDLLGSAISNPVVQHGAEIYGAKKFLVDPLLNKLGGMMPNAPVAPSSQIVVPQNVGGGPRPMPNIGTPQGTWNALQSPSAPVAPQAAVTESQPGMLARAGRSIAQGASKVAPYVGAGAEMSLMPAAIQLPYGMAAYEQQKIRQNPNAPGLENNPYAQVVRGQAATQGQAGAANQMRAVANMPYGNVSPQERQILDQDAMMRQAIRKKAFEKVMGPVAPQ